MRDEHTADFRRFKRDHGYDGNLTRGNAANRFREGEREAGQVLRAFRSKDPGVRIDADTAVKKIENLFESGKIGLNTARSAIREILPDGGSALTHKPRTLRELNTAMQLGIIGRDEGAHAAAERISPGDPANRLIHEKIIPDRLKLAEKSRSGKPGHRSFRIVRSAGKISVKTALTGGKLAGGAGRKLMTDSADAQLGGGSGSPVLDELEGSARKTGGKAVAAAGRIMSSGAGSVAGNARAYSKMRGGTITAGDIAKTGKKFREKKTAAKYAGIYTRKLRSDDVHHAEKMPGAVRSVAGGAARDMGRTAGTDIRKKAAEAPADMLRSSGRRMSKLTTDAFGVTDPTLGEIGAAAGKAAAPLTRPVRTAKRTGRAVQATKKAAAGVGRAAVTVIRSAVHAAAFLVSNPAGWAVLTIAFAAALMIVFFGSCTGVSVPFLDSLAAAFSQYQVSRNTAWIAEQEYCYAESKLYASARTQLTVAEAVEAADPGNSYGLNETNSYITYSADTVYHNPYNLISYMEAKYECEWDLDDLYYEIDCGIFREQYDWEVGIDMGQNEGEPSVTNRWVLTSALTNNGFDATARRLLSELDDTGGMLGHYLALNYYYGMTEYDGNEYNDDGTVSRSGFWWDPDYAGALNGYWWDVEIYRTHDDNVTIDEFMDGVTGGFDADVPPGGRSVSGGSVVSDTTGYMWPLEDYFTVSSPFGEQRSYEDHHGIDIPAPEGTPILCSKDGTVMENSWNSSRGWYVRILHEDGTSTICQHMCEQSTAVPGSAVKQGQVIGYVGDTGYSFGDHLHFEVWQPNGQSWPYCCIDPMLLFPDL